MSKLENPVVVFEAKFNGVKVAIVRHRFVYHSGVNFIGQNKILEKSKIKSNREPYGFTEKDAVNGLHNKLIYNARQLEDKLALSKRQLANFDKLLSTVKKEK